MASLLKITSFAAATALVGFAGSASFAQSFGNISGEFGLTAGSNSVKEVDSSPDEGSFTFGVLSGSVDIGLNGGFSLIVDGNYRYDDFGGDFDNDEDPSSEYTIGAHFLRDFGQSTRAGLFLAYGDTLPQDGDADDAYDVLLYGFELQSSIADELQLYAQLGLGSKSEDSGDNGEGFTNGITARVGLIYNYSDRTSFTADFEMASANPYIDDDDAGRFYGITLSGETRILSNTPLYANYFVRRDVLDSTTEGDSLSEVQVGVGISYAFGGGSDSIGLPRLPTRASAWTEWMD